MNKSATNEQTKLLASFFNTVAAAFVTTGVLAPVVTVIYGLGGISLNISLVIGSSIICIMMSAGLHVAGRRFLARIVE